MRGLRLQRWSLGRIVREMDGRLVSPTVDANSLTGVSTDTRSIEEGEIFFALRGERFDGHDFVEEAIRRGAAVVVVENDSALGSGRVPGVVVDDCIEALGRLGHAVFRAARQDGLHSVAVTGSNGKTTTKELLGAIWGVHGEVWATPGNLNNHIGVPLTLCGLPVDCDHLIVEMGANHRGEISELIRLAPADQRIITSIGRAHLEGFGSMAGVRKAKAEIFEVPERHTAAIMPRGERPELVPRDFPGHVLSFGEQDGADVRVVDTDVFDRDGRAAMEVQIQTGRLAENFVLPLVGRHHATNLAAAWATVCCSGVELEVEAVREALAGVSLPAGRFRIVSVGPLQILDDAYNANPSSMRASYRAFEQWCEGGEDIPRVAVVGDMHELGEAAGRDHRRLGQWLANRPRLAAVVFVGEFAELMAESASEGKLDCIEVIDDHEAVADWLVGFGPARVFVKGSRGNRLEQIVERLESKR